MNRILTIGAATVCLGLLGGVSDLQAEQDERRGPPDKQHSWKSRGPDRRRGEGSRGEFGKRMEGMRDLLEKLKDEAPEEFERLMQLRQTDRRAFMQEIQKLARTKGLDIGRRGPGHSPEERKCDELGKLYQETQDAAEKSRIKTELKAAVEAAFRKRIDMQRQRLAKMEEQIGKIRDGLAQREKDQSKICETRLEELTRDPALSWEHGVR